MKIFKKIFFATLVAISFCTISLAQGLDLSDLFGLFRIPTPAVVKRYEQTKAEKEVRKVTHLVRMQSLDQDNGCSATAIGPHAILTATHCEAPSDLIGIDGTDGYPIVGHIRDGNDHTIFLLGGITFPYYAVVRPREFRPSEFVFIWGNPSIGPIQYVAQLTTGSYIASHVFQGRIVDVFGMKSERGDSGSGVFDAKGNLIGVVTFGGMIKVPPDGRDARIAGAIRLNFPPSAYEKAANF